MIEESTAVRMAAIFGSVAHPVRIHIVKLLEEGELSVGEISERLHLGQSSTSHHLAALLRTGILAVAQRGTSRFYRVRGPKASQAMELIREFCRLQNLHGEPEGDDA